MIFSYLNSKYLQKKGAAARSVEEEDEMGRGGEGVRWWRALNTKIKIPVESRQENGRELGERESRPGNREEDEKN